MGCGTKTFTGITPYKRDVIVDAIKNAGGTITGDNPYHATGLQAGTVLDGTWNPADNTLVVTMDTDPPCFAVWPKIEGMIQKVQAMPEPQANAPRPALASAHINEFRKGMATIAKTLPKLAKTTTKQAQAPQAQASAGGAIGGMSTGTIALIGAGVLIGGYFLLKDK